MKRGALQREAALKRGLPRLAVSSTALPSNLNPHRSLAMQRFILATLALAAAGGACAQTAPKTGVYPITIANRAATS